MALASLLRSGAAQSLALLASLALFVALGARAEAPSPDYKLVWADEFDGEQLDTTKWDHRQLGKRRLAVNTKDSVRLDGQGHLVITTSKAGDEYHTGMIGTQGKFEPVFGYFECKVKFQTQQGHWSAFWLQTPTMGKVVGDPKQSGTEIDIFEYLAREPGLLQMNLHWDGYGEHHKSAGTKVTIPSVTEGFHTYGLLWTSKEYVFDVDGKEVWRSSAGGVSQVAEYLKLTEEIGSWAGDIKTAALPDYFKVDYVRVYEAVR